MVIASVPGVNIKLEGLPTFIYSDDPLNDKEFVLDTSSGVIVSLLIV